MAIVLLESDRGGSQYQEFWEQAIRDSLQDHGAMDSIQLVSAADLRGVPFFLRSFVRGKFPREREKWCLMDWRGELAQAYEFESDRCNIVVFDRNHDVVHASTVQELDIRELRVLATTLRKLKDESD